MACGDNENNMMREARTEPGGRAALAAWDAGDDSLYEAADKTWWLRVVDDEDRALILRRDLGVV